jgi:hypothetical protein
MKTNLLAGGLALALLHTPPKPKDWHWLASAQWVRKNHPAPTWRVKTEPSRGDTVRLDCLSTNGAHITYHLLRNRLVAITFHFPEDYSYQANWIYEGAVFQGGHEWLDQAAHARIVARPEGEQGIAYEVRYAPIAKE